jgi:ABC-2 type transport system ATP-binding protein
VREHLTVFAKLYEVPEAEKRIDAMTEIFRVNEFRNTLCGDLSAGNTARVNLCRAFINHPKLVLLDEPTSSMDPEVAVAVRKYLLMVQEKYNTSILITSHNMAEVEELADRVIFINHGKIIAEGAPGALVKKTMPLTRVKLFMRDGQKRTVEYCRKHRLKAVTEDRYAEIDIAEEKIAGLLNDLGKLGVDYSEISINKPTLEDFFLGEAGHDA